MSVYATSVQAGYLMKGVTRVYRGVLPMVFDEMTDLAHTLETLDADHFENNDLTTPLSVGGWRHRNQPV